MSVISRLITWSDNQVLTASALNGEFNNIINDYNGSITNTNISASAAISASKLAAIPEAGITFSGSGHGHSGSTDGKLVAIKPIVASVNVTALFQTGSASNVDITGHTITFTPTVTSNALVTFSGLWYNTIGGSTSNTLFMAVLLDGVAQGPGGTTLIKYDPPISSGFVQYSASLWLTNLSAEAHTIKLQGSVNGGGQLNVASGTLQAIVFTA